MASDGASKTPAWVGYAASIGFVLVFVLGIVAGRFLAALPIARALAYWDLAATLGTMADDNQDHAIRAAAYLDADRAKADMHTYTWVMRNAPAPFVGTVTAEGTVHGASVTHQGFRAANPPEMPKPAGRVRILLTGGSTAFSVGAPAEDRTIAGYLQAELNRDVSSSTVAYEVVTYANPSWGTTHERIAVVNVLQHFDPDLVISFSGTNDCMWGQIGRDAHFFRTHYEETYFRVADEAARLAGRDPIPDPVRNAEGPVPVETMLARLVDNVAVATFTLQRRDVPYLFALQPTLYAATKPTDREKGLLEAQNPEKHAYFDEAYPKIAGRLSEYAQPGFHFADLSDVFADAPGADGREFFLDAYHFGDRGNRRIAARLAEVIRDRGLLR